MHGSDVDLDRVLRATLVVEPPAEVRASLSAMVAAWRPTSVAVASPVSRPVIAWAPWLLTAGLVGLALIQLAYWLAPPVVRLYGSLADSGLMLGDVFYAIQIVLLSPMLGRVADVRLEWQGLAFWSAVAAAAWLLSSAGPLRGLAARLGVPA